MDHAIGVTEREIGTELETIEKKTRARAINSQKKKFNSIIRNLQN